jgi:hypothetical protein
LLGVDEQAKLRVETLGFLGAESHEAKLSPARACVSVESSSRENHSAELVEGDKGAGFLD